MNVRRRRRRRKDRKGDVKSSSDKDGPSTEVRSVGYSWRRKEEDLTWVPTELNFFF